MTKTFAAVIGASGVAVGFDRVWIVSPSSASVVALDPRSGQVLKRIGVGVEPNAVAVGGDSVWVANRADDTVSKIDAQTASVRDVIPVGSRPDGIAAGARDVWVANGGDGTMTRLDPASGDIAKVVVLDNPPRGVALTPTGVYVAVQSTGIEHRGGALKVLFVAENLVSIDPGAAGFSAYPILLATNDGLVGFRRVGGVEGAQLVPNLAVALPTPSDGGTTYTFEVRSGIRYSNGKLVQPDDFKRAIERLFTLSSSGESGYYSGIVGADRCATGKPCDLSRGIVTDRSARTITFRLKQPDADFLAKLALPFAVAVPAGTPARDVGLRPIPATGPYRIVGFQKKSKTIRLARNPAFREWSVDAQPRGFPNSITVSLRFGSDTSAALRAVEQGAADVALGGGTPFSKEELDAIAARSPNQLRLNTTLSTNYFFLNTRVAPFDDVRVRRAVNIAFERESFVRMLGRSFVPTCQILPPNLPGYRPTCPYFPGGAPRLEVARRLVRSSGTTGAQVIVRVPADISDQGHYMVSVLNSLGYRARVVAVSANRYFDVISDSRTQAQIGYWGWVAGFPSAADFIPPQFSCAAYAPASPGQNTNVSGFCDRSIDDQMRAAAAAQAQDPAAATTLWQEVDRALLARAPVVPVYNRGNVDFVSKRVGNYQYNPQWGVLLAQLWVK